jgi:hypothetical protein
MLELSRRKETHMAGFSKRAAGSPNLQIVEWFQGAELGAPKPEAPLRSVYNPKTGQYEQISLPEFQHLLRQGKIEESASFSPYNGHEQTVYRLV